MIRSSAISLVLPLALAACGGGGAHSDADAAVAADGHAATDAGTATDATPETDARPITSEIDWIPFPAGSFVMGSDSGDLAQAPAHTVNVPAFEMGRFEVTVGQYRACVRAGACTNPGKTGDCNWHAAGRENHPINCVDWHQAQAFAAYVGNGAHLPTEAEWEYAARSGGQGKTFPWGNAAPTCDVTVMKDHGLGCGEAHTWPVCSKLAGNTEQDLCDMAGNVYEWMEDTYKEGYADAPTDGSAYTGASAEHTGRGGSWYDEALHFFATRDRFGVDPQYRYIGLGFRLARSRP